MSQKRVLLIDADILVYLVATTEEKPIEWEDDMWTLHSDFASARTQFKQRVADLVAALKADSVIMCLTTMTKNFRKDILPTYKANRKKVRKPLVWGPLREFCETEYETFIRDGLEGDDCLGILATRTADQHDEKIVVSIDKDMKTIPGKFYNMGKPELGIQAISDADADYYHMLQTLMGDATDGYAGCQGIGPKTAEKILQAPLAVGETVWSRVVATYKKAGFGEDYALVQARCARILRASDYDFKNKQPILWEPPR